MILIVIEMLKGWDGYILGYEEYKISKMHIHSCLSIPPECGCEEGSVALTIVAVIIYY